jgi:two-component system sensor histidine kinase KdpD
VQWDEEAQYSFALAIEREADRLNRLVGNLLDMSRIENGALKPEKEWFPLDELIHDVLNHLEPVIDGRTIITNIPPDLPPLKFDYLHMDQVFTNLIENALRYTPRESPIEIEAHQQGSSVQVNIADRGPGIPTSDLERVFDKFYRIMPKKGRGPHPGGSGLGLAVSKGLVEAHNGSIWAQQREGGGVVFTVELPIGVREVVAA